MCQNGGMRTTLNIDDDVLQAARELAATRNMTLGQIFSEWARAAMTPSPGGQGMRNGVPILPPKVGETLVTSEIVAQLAEDECNAKPENLLLLPA